MVRVKGANIGALSAEAKRRVRVYREALQVKVDAHTMRLSKANELDKNYVEKMDAEFPKKSQKERTPRSRRKSVGVTRIPKPDSVAPARSTKPASAPKQTKPATEEKSSSSSLPTVEEAKEPPQEILTPKATTEKKVKSTRSLESVSVVDQAIVAWLVLSAFVVVFVEIEIMLVHQPLKNPRSHLSPYLPPDMLAEALHGWFEKYDPLLLHR